MNLVVNGATVEVDDEHATLLTVLREQLGLHSVKDGCAPQGQCGCCTVLVDGQPRVACVTPVRRIAGRAITTAEALPDRDALANAFVATGASQCGFCTPGILCRLSGHRSRTGALDATSIREALKAHLCRCTGWQTITEAATLVDAPPLRDLEAASIRASIEGNVTQRVGREVCLGAGGFADDTAPAEALVALRRSDGEWVVAETLTDARRLTGKVQGRRTTDEPTPPLALPPGDWARTLQTSWVEPAYLETDATWCVPGGEAASLLANGGAFGGKLASPLGGLARQLADRHGRPVRVMLSREDAVRLGPKRPPIAAGIRPDGSGILRVARTPGAADRARAIAPLLEIEEVDVVGPPTSIALRAALWAELHCLTSALTGASAVTSPTGATADATVDASGIRVTVAAGRPLDEIVLRSYCIGAAHMAYSLVTSEALAIAPDGEIGDLTIRSFRIVRAGDTPPIHVTIEPSDEDPVNGSDAVFAAVAAATWKAAGYASSWPTGALRHES